MSDLMCVDLRLTAVDEHLDPFRKSVDTRLDRLESLLLRDRNRFPAVRGWSVTDFLDFAEKMRRTSSSSSHAIQKEIRGKKTSQHGDI